jgi:phage/plasmid-associated DNA primase
MAYTMTGENNQKVILLFLGEKDGGKSTFVELHNDIMGKFACSVNERILCAQKNKSTHDSELFNLIGKRLSSLSETSEKQEFNMVLLNKISGRDTVNIRGAGEKETLDIKFLSVLLILANTIPNFNSTDDTSIAFASRLRAFNFCNKFIRDSSYVEQLYSLKDAFFSLLVEYAVKYYNNGKTLQTCTEIDNYTKTIIDDKDSVKWWCKTQHYVKTTEKSDWVENTSLFDKYNTDCQENKRKNIVGKIEFYKKFRQYYQLEEAVQIKYKENGIERIVRGFRYLKEVIEPEENVIIQPESSESE